MALYCTKNVHFLREAEYKAALRERHQAVVMFHLGEEGVAFGHAARTHMKSCRLEHVQQKSVESTKEQEQTVCYCSLLVSRP
jgi:hypothetical protein